MQNKHTIRDRCILLTLLFIFSIGTYSLFGNIKSVNFYELAGYQHRVKGTVTDSNGIPIPRVNVEIKGTSYGTFTDKEGYFYVDAAPTDVLILSYIGFKPLEVLVGNSEELSLILEEDVTNLEAVTVNAGYYTVKERERTGSIAKVTAEEIELQPVVSPLETLQGRMAGIEIIQGNAIPGNAPTVRIRGQNSLRTDGNYPLYIIDGVPIISTPIEGGSNMYIGGIDPLSSMNLSNIESIEVLKDADATSIYGSRGANGVVLITTKKANYNKKTEIETRWYSGLGKVSRKIDLLNTEQYIALRKAGLENDGREPNEITDYDLLLWDQNRYTDWQEVLFGGTSYINDFNISISGGNSTTSFRLGGSYHKEGIVFPGDNNYHKATVNLNLNHISKNEKLGINLSVNYGLDKSDVPATIINSFVSMALSLPPNAPELYNQDGSLHWEKWNLSGRNNPLAPILNRTSTDRGNNLVANIGVSYAIIPGIKVKLNGGYTNLSRRYKGLFSKNEYRPELRESREHSSIENHRERSSWVVEPQFLYDFTFGKGTIDGLVGLTFQENTSRNLRVDGNGFVSEALIGDLSAAAATNVINNKEIDYRYNAIFARLAYNYNEKYIVNLTGRRDGSSRFGTNKRFANFWAVGGAWIFSEEPFIENNLPFLSFGKFRGSYGTTGNDQIGDYGYLDAYEATDGPNGLYPTQLTNPDYSWEVNKKLEAAIELGFIQDRITMGVSWYRNRSSNQLVGFPLPSITGFLTVQANMPATVQNTGWEFVLSSLNLSSKNFRWKTFVNLTIPKSKLLDFPDIEESSYANTYRIGYPLNIRLLYQYDGLDSETGLHTVADINKDNTIDDINDHSVIKDMGRKYYGGITNNISFGNLDVNFLVEFVKQEATSLYFDPPGYASNQVIGVFQKWKNNSPDIQKVSGNYDAFSAHNLAMNSDYSISDASFIRLKTLSVKYNIANHLKKGLLSDCSIFIQAQNLFTFSNYANSLNIESPGNAVIPSLRTITLGCQVTF
ncbi:TonB-dependent outer membrane receptor [Galbibacter marinus]|uniref:TonB-dependent outer membrane receptor n=1 Tax=Galbibacter marinus TaxID=555500 RepID=K2P200_9FLAO|nr:SusC/RagA family TonB-linked outer membrane protein [Galbibacter marinus]EKF55078.1 TonB-dependent outer membrane receptor [Galbibacter marinus]